MPALASTTVFVTEGMIEAWLRLSATRLRERSRELTELDQAIGDGDHGINMDRGFTAVAAMLDGRSADPAAPAPDVAGTLKQTAQTLIRTVGGTSALRHVLPEGVCISRWEPSANSRRPDRRARCGRRRRRDDRWRPAG